MDNSPYEAKVVASTRGKKNKNVVVIAPNGNQYSVPRKGLEAFKKTLRVDNNWEVLK